MFGNNFNNNDDDFNNISPKTGNETVGNYDTTIEDDIDLIIQIGYIASKVRNLSLFYNNFNLENPFSNSNTNSENNNIVTSSATSSPTTANVLCRKTIFENLLIQFYKESVCAQKQQQKHKQRKHFENFIMTSGSNSFEKLIPIDDEINTTIDTGVFKTSPKPKSNRSTSLVPSLLPSELLQCTPTCRRNNSLNDANISCFPSTTNVQVQIAFTQSSDSGDSINRGALEIIPGNSTIGRKSTIILSKSCSNVDGTNTALYTSSNGSQSASGFVKSKAKTSDLESFLKKNGGKSIEISTTSGDFDQNNSTALVKLKNTIIQCQFDKDDINAIIIDLKRKVEYTERMNWLYLSKRPMGPPHRKTSLPKHSEVKKRFLEICDTTFSDEVKSALRLPAFDSYEWEDAEIIHLMQTMFCDLGFIDKFNIPISTLREWLYEVYKHYNEVPFHNFRHCFCVAQMMYAITKQANLISRLGELECLILLVSCICHDLDHPGYNNIYQINARTELALRYNDISPLENHHCSIAFRLLEHPDCNIFKNFGRDTFNFIREGIIRCILATDMARHNEILTQFKDVVPSFDYSNRAHINLLCMILIKVADISNEARPMDVAEPWLDRLLQEFFAQSAAEKSEGLPVTPFMDPDKVSKPGSQVRFIGLVLLPLFEALGELLPDIIELIIIPVRVALDYYKRLNDAQNRPRKSLGDNTENNSSDGGVSPQLPRSQSGISVKSRRSIPSQKSASRNSVDEPTCIAAELHDLPEGSESGDSETATEVDVAEKTSKFKVDTESSNRSKSSHSNSRKSSREKRPSMIGELCSTGGNRIRNSYGNIHGYHHNQSRHHFGSNRAVSLDQYSYNNRRLSDALPQVISDSNVFYNRFRGSIDTTSTDNQVHINSSIDTRKQAYHKDISNMDGDSVNLYNKLPMESDLAQKCSEFDKFNQFNTNGNCSKNESDVNTSTTTANHSVGKTWKAKFKQISEYFSMSFDRSSKRLSSSANARNNTMSMKNNNTPEFVKKHGICSTISNNLSPNIKQKQELINAGRNRAYSLDVPVPSPRNRNSSSSGGDSRKSSRNEDNSNRLDITLNEDNNSNNTSSGDVPPSIRVGGVDGNESIILSASSMPHPIASTFIADLNYCGSIESGSGTDADVIISGYNKNPPKI